MIAGTLEVQMLANLARLASDMAQAKSMVGGAMKNIESAVGHAKAALGALGIGLSMAGVVAFAKHALDAADDLGKLSQKVGISTEKLSEFKLAAELGDVASDAFAKGLKAFNLALVEATNQSSKASKVFAALGVDVKAGPAEAFRQFAEAISKLPDGELKTAAATEILKKAGADWIPVLNGGAKGLDEAAEKAKKLGLIVSDDFAKQAERFNDNMRLVQKSAMGFANALLSGGVLDVIDDIGKRLAKAAEEGTRLRTALEIARRIDAATGAALSPNDPLFQRRQEQYLAEDLYGGPGPVHRGQIAIGKIRGVKPQAPAASAGAPDPDALRRALAESEALQKRQLAAIQQMEEKRKSLFDLNEQEIMLERVRVGSYKDFDAQAKVRLLNLALELDLRSQLIKRIDLQLEAHKREADILRGADDLARDYSLAGRQNIEQLEHETALIGRTLGEQERRNALRAIELDLLGRKRQIGELFGDNAAGAMVAVAKAEQEAARQRKAVTDALNIRQQGARLDIARQAIEAIELETTALGMSSLELEKVIALRALEIQQYGRVLTEQDRSVLLTEKDVDARRRLIEAIEERQRLERDWLTGGRQALNDYADAAGNVAKSTRDAFTVAFRGAEDALVRFVQTGKANLRDLASAAVADITRGVIRQGVTGPLAALGAGLLDKLFAPDFGPVLGAGITGFATGGEFTVGGSGGTDSRLVAFRATPGERVTVQTPEQQASGRQVKVVFNITTPDVGSFRAARSHIVADMHAAMRRI